MNIDRSSLILKQKNIKINIFGKYPILYLAGHHTIGFTRLCRDHMLEMNIDGGWRVDAFTVEYRPKLGDNNRDEDYKIVHIGACIKCMEEGKGIATEENIRMIANKFVIQVTDSDEEDSNG